MPRYVRMLRRALSSVPSRPLSQPTAFTHPYIMSEQEVTPGITRSEYVARRTRLSKQLPERSISLFPSNAQAFMSEDVPYPYHPNTDLQYVAGIQEPGAVLLADGGGGETRYVLFVPGRDATRELWDGPVCGVGEETRAYFEVDEVRECGDLPRYLEQALPHMDAFYFDGRINVEVSGLLRGLSPADQQSLKRKWSETAPKTFLAEQRLVKSSAEVALLRRAGSVMAGALNEAMARCAVDEVEERCIEAWLEHGCKLGGAQRMAFPCVVGSGHNGTILHYMANTRTARRGDMVMVDAGCQVHGYCSDVSRTWPIGGSFSGAQRDAYALVLDVQKNTLKRLETRAGKDRLSLDELHMEAVRDMVDGLLSLGFLHGQSMESALLSGAYARYFPHATGHYLGLDVHDTHGIPKTRPLSEGMVITVEPGFYCRADDMDAPAAFRGLGIRVEDDALVLADSVEVLSDEAVKEITDVECLVQSGAAQSTPSVSFLQQ